MNANAKMFPVIASSKLGAGLLSLVMLVLTLLSATLSAREVTTTIDFTGLTDGLFTIYNQFEFTISSSSGAWIASTTYGNPPPYIYFNNPDGVSAVTSSIKVTMDNSTFKFSSVDLYSSITTIPYTFTGYLKSSMVFNVTGTIPHTFGGFATATNSHNTDVIDTLEITLTNPPSCCPNPMGLDNIVLTASLSVGGSVTGVSPTKVLCQNVTTRQHVVIQDGGKSWNCEEAGLVVNRGDRVRITVQGIAD